MLLAMLGTVGAVAPATAARRRDPAPERLPPAARDTDALPAPSASPDAAPVTRPTRGCGSRGGPGYRLPNGRCASHGRR